MLLFVDGHDGYGTSGTAVGDGRYPSGSGTQNVATGNHGHATQFPSGGSQGYFQTPSLTTDPTLVIGFGLYLESYESLFRTQILSLLDSVFQGMVVDIDSSHHIRVSLNSGNPQATGTTALSLSTWYYLELVITSDLTSGTFELYLNGLLELSGSGVTANGTHNYSDIVRFLGSGTGQAHRIDDVYILDASGSVNNVRLGADTKVISLLPTGDGTTLQFTPNSGSNHYSRVNENPLDSANYNESTTVGDTDLYTYPPCGVDQIYGIQVTTAIDGTGNLVTPAGATSVAAPGLQRVVDESITDPITLDSTQFGGKHGP